MSQSLATLPPSPVPPALIPLLENGDHLTRDEFERRYEAMPHVKKAELIEGVVYMGSAVRVAYHGAQHADIIAWLGVYRSAHPGLMVADNSTVRLDETNEPQPDAILFRLPSHGGQARFTEDGYLEGAPELAVEVASSSASYDLNEKLGAYQRNGILEYLVWRVLDRQFDWFVLRGAKYERQSPDAGGILRSTVFPGLWLDAAALLRGDMAQVLAVLQQGISARNA